MTSIFGHRPTDRPPQTEEWSTGVTISIAAHLALIGALWWGLHWRSSQVAVESTAELWSAVPEAAAPPPVETPPPPPAVETPPPPAVETPKPPDIVVEQIKEKKPPKPTPPPPPPPPKPAPPKPAPPPPPPQPKLDAKALQKLHDENLKRMMGQMDAPATATGTAARNSGPSANWAGKVAALIKQHLVYTDSMSGLRSPDIEIRLGVDGSILSQKITKSSGNAAFDDAVLRAVIGTQKLPRDTDGSLPPDVIVTFNP
ncbi:energy transducer TonB [Scleromatobacter humisilvae]|uniref:TonB C-terminal domain-containing protein n=1 Tax=Scleromatobacter humisilvae TaxID=2897159 RepID=A0A9X2C1Q6_9BURK|nr:energy transducer TonB [Scleromatobacter humisilvae]MCK9687826.1 TonB C-terminal domain-containing protein [Scleromatobacter humisilvae]